MNINCDNNLQSVGMVWEMGCEGYGMQHHWRYCLKVWISWEHVEICYHPEMSKLGYSF